MPASRKKSYRALAEVRRASWTDCFAGSRSWLQGTLPFTRHSPSLKPSSSQAPPTLSRFQAVTWRLAQVKPGGVLLLQHGNRSKSRQRNRQVPAPAPAGSALPGPRRASPPGPRCLCWRRPLARRICLRSRDWTPQALKEAKLARQRTAGKAAVGAQASRQQAATPHCCGQITSGRAGLSR